MDECKRRIGDVVTYAKGLHDSVLDTQVIFHVTEWKEFRMSNWKIIKQSMKPNPVMIDGRNAFETDILEGFEYWSIGR